MFNKLKLWLKKFLPNRHRLREEKSLQMLSGLLHDPYLWRLNRRSVSMSVAAGFFVMMIPLPFQMLLAAALAVLVRANLPISIAMVWISNPITTPFLIYSSYHLGTKVLGVPNTLFNYMEFSWDWLTAELPNIGKPLIVGTLIIASVGALLLYFGIELSWRLFVLWYKKYRVRKFKN